MSDDNQKAPISQPLDNSTSLEQGVNQEPAKADQVRRVHRRRFYRKSSTTSKVEHNTEQANQDLAQNPNLNQGHNQEPNLGQNPNLNQGYKQEPNFGQNTNLNQGHNQDPSLGQNPNLNQGHNQDPNLGQNPNPNQGYNQNQNLGQSLNPNQGYNQNQNLGQNPNQNQGYNQSSNSGKNQNFNQSYQQNGTNFNKSQAGANNQADLNKAKEAQARIYANFRELEEPVTPKVNSKKQFQDNIAIHILMVGIISLVLLIPTIFFDAILSDRESSQSYAVRSMSRAWAEEQTITDPQILFGVNQLVGYEMDSERNQVQSKRYQQKTAYINPEKSESQINIESEKRYRGNYESTLYTATIKQKAVFNLYNSLDLLSKKYSSMSDSLTNIRIGFKVDDSRGIDEIKSIKVNGNKVEALPAQSFIGFEVPLPESMFYANRKIDVEIEYLLRGSQQFSFASLGKISEVKVSGTGAVPSFKGDFLPREREVSSEDKTFSAYYYLNNMATGQTEVSMGNSDSHSEYANQSEQMVIDIVLKDESQSYVLINRLLKYVLLFIAMTFVCVLAFEIICKHLVSLVQYVVIGVALILFYMVLLALSEHINFTLSYIIGAVLMASMISLYVKAVFNSKKHGLAIFLLLVSMYSVLFAIVHIEAYALLVGTILLVIMLGIVMYITRHLNSKFNV